MKIIWISDESLEIVGIGILKKGIELEVSDKLGKQLIGQKLVKEITKKSEKKEK
jgi:hypothetical protein